MGSVAAVERQKRCPDCKVMKQFSGYNNKATTRDRKDVYCRDCCRKHKDRYRRPERLAEISHLEYALAQEPWHEDRVNLNTEYQWFAKIGYRDVNFEYPIDNESVAEARLRWLRQRTQIRQGAPQYERR